MLHILCNTTFNAAVLCSSLHFHHHIPIIYVACEFICIFNLANFQFHVIMFMPVYSCSCYYALNCYYHVRMHFSSFILLTRFQLHFMYVAPSNFTSVTWMYLLYYCFMLDRLCLGMFVTWSGIPYVVVYNWHMDLLVCWVACIRL